jgi:hypothetical protein
MAEELASANVNRAYTLAATTIAIFTFSMFFLYPRFVNGEADPILFQAAIVVLGLAAYSFVFASLYYYGASLGSRITDAERARSSRRGDRFWLIGYTMLFLAPSLILFSVRLLAVGSVWLTLWLVYGIFVMRYFPRVQTAKAG